MTAIYGFMRRDYLTCYSCYNMVFQGIHPYCTSNGCPIKWAPRDFGCASYFASDRRDED